MAAVDPGIVLTEPGHSLYCLDHDTRRALFVRTEVDPGGAPFYFQAQYEHATGVVALSYDELHALPTPGEPSGVFLYSTGRCGSTLVAAALAERGGLTGLSEPDVLTQLVTLAPRLPEPELRELTRSCVRLLSRGHPVAVKPRSFVIELAWLLHEEFPQFASVFLYREPLSWARSTARAFAGYDPALNTDPAAVQDRLGRLIPLVARWRQRVGRVLSPRRSWPASGWRSWSVLWRCGIAAWTCSPPPTRTCSPTRRACSSPCSRTAAWPRRPGWTRSWPGTPRRARPCPGQPPPLATARRFRASTRPR
ncbi:hypothetical protein ACFQZ4_02215 [Catellatospora coxensis]